MRGDQRLQPGQRDLKIRHIRGDHLELKPRLLGKGPVLREIGGNGNQLSAGDAEGPEHAAQLRSRAAAQKEFLRLSIRTVPAVQVLGDGLPGLQVAGGGGIAMDQEGRGIQQDVPNGIVHPFGRGNGGVAQGIVVDVLRPHNGGTAPAVLKKLPDAGAVGSQGVGGLVEHGWLPSFQGQIPGPFEFAFALRHQAVGSL